MSDLSGTAGDDSLRGGGAGDLIDLSQGGADSVSGGGGDDVVLLGSTFGPGDQIEGGAGFDTLVLDGDYGAGLLISRGMMHGVEALQLTAGHGYSLTIGARVVGHAATLEIDAQLAAADRLSLDMVQMRGGQITVQLGGGSADIHTETARAVVIAGPGAGRVLLHGGDAPDFLRLERPMRASDHFDGAGAGDSDLLVLTQSTKLHAMPKTLHDVDAIALRDGQFHLVLDDANLSAGQRLFVDGQFLQAGNDLHFDGSAERDGAFSLNGGAAHDLLVGGAQADTMSAGADDDRLVGGLGRDELTGGADADRFIYRSVAESPAGAGADLIVDLQDEDRIDLHRIDADLAKPGDQHFHLVDGFSGHAGELTISYDGASSSLLQADVDGDGVADFELLLLGDHRAFAGLVM